MQCIALVAAALLCNAPYFLLQLYQSTREAEAVQLQLLAALAAAQMKDTNMRAQEAAIKMLQRRYDQERAARLQSQVCLVPIPPSLHACIYWKSQMGVCKDPGKTGTAALSTDTSSLSVSLSVYQVELSQRQQAHAMCAGENEASERAALSCTNELRDGLGMAHKSSL